MSKKKQPKTIQIVLPKNKDVVDALKVATTLTGMKSMSQFMLAAAVEAALEVLEVNAAAIAETQKKSSIIMPNKNDEQIEATAAATSIDTDKPKIII